jgi:acyl-CoA synthetase (NDP forming)
VVADPDLGPLIGVGDEWRLAPLTDVDADELVHGGKAGKLVAGFRGAPPADAAALADLLLRLSRLGEDLPEVAELDLNPVLAFPEGCLAVDARIRLRRPEPAGTLKTW